MILIVLLAWLLFGFVVGAITRAILPGSHPMSLLSTSVLGIVGSLTGGTLGNLAWGLPLFTLHTAGFVGSLIGALIVLALGGISMRASRSA